MDTIAVSEFKATCAAVVERVRKTKRPVTITRFGKPVAQLVPPPQPPRKRRLGGMAAYTQILGDIVGPIGSYEDWDVWR